jgi:hypothetical protein
MIFTLPGRAILGPEEQPLWPARRALAWHRRHTFLAQ